MDGHGRDVWIWMATLMLVVAVIVAEVMMMTGIVIMMRMMRRLVPRMILSWIWALGP